MGFVCVFRPVFVITVGLAIEKANKGEQTC